ncbi:MAG: carbon monoxide dehydrogenase subunit G [Rhodospirillaceae bacterium]|nr:carbon monoxide dehydrogenase subunit G [Rhodospirillaceae bacterium]
MKIEESFAVPAPIEKVWAVITDPQLVGPCIPGCQGVEVTGPTSYKSSIRIGIGPINATFVVVVEITEQRPPDFLSATTKGDEGGRLSSLSATSQLKLEPLADGGTNVAYSSEVSVVGRLGKFGLGIMKKKAKSLGDEFATALRKTIEAQQAAPAETTPAA